MTTFPIVDAHVHVLFPDPAGRDPVRDAYEIWEYGQHGGVEVLDSAGTIEEVTAAMHAARCDHFVTANLFVAADEIAKLGTGLATRPRLDEHVEQLRERLIQFNSWAVEVFTAVRQRRDHLPHRNTGHL